LENVVCFHLCEGYDLVHCPLLNEMSFFDGVNFRLNLIDCLTTDEDTNGNSNGGGKINNNQLKEVPATVTEIAAMTATTTTMITKATASLTAAWRQ
jgi:hypothetical protein